MEREPIPPLELAFRVAKLGGWNAVQLLTPESAHAHNVGNLTWQYYNGLEQYYLNPYHPDVVVGTGVPEGWYVYDVRRKPGATT